MNMATLAARCGRVLVVDDDAGIRDSLRELLELEGFEVDTAEHGRAGLQRIEAQGVPCLVLLDMMMPVMNGLEFLQALRHHPDPAVAGAPVAVVSALDEASAVQAPYQCCEVLPKPLDVDRLIDTVQRYC
jgi:CheY-like chemotaxis protein